MLELILVVAAHTFQGIYKQKLRNNNSKGDSEALEDHY